MSKRRTSEIEKWIKLGHGSGIEAEYRLAPKAKAMRMGEYPEWEAEKLENYCSYNCKN